MTPSAARAALQQAESDHERKSWSEADRLLAQLRSHVLSAALEADWERDPLWTLHTEILALQLRLDELRPESSR